MEYIANSMEKRVTAVSRQSNYDFLRFLAMMGVIINHVSDIFVFRNGDHLLTTYIWEGAGAFAVPAFLMISGSFLIDKESTANALEFYKKSFRKIGLHTIIFSCFYFFRVLLMKLRASSGIAAAFSAALRFQLTGWTGHPLWFVYSLAGIYCILPILASLKKKYGAYKEYHVFAMLYCVWAFLSLYFEQLPMSWSTGRAFGYLGFVILGNEIHTFVSEKGNNAGGGMLLIAGFLVYIVQNILLYCHVQNGGEYYTKVLNATTSPLSILGIALIFSGISMLNIRCKFRITVKYSFFIYLVHGWVLDILYGAALKFGPNLLDDCRVCIPIGVTLTFLISLMLSMAYEKVFSLIIERNSHSKVQV